MNETTNIAEEKLCAYEYEHNDGDQIWSDHTTFYKDGQKIKRVFEEGYLGGKTSETYISASEMIEEINLVKDKIKKQTKHDRGGYSILKDLVSADLEIIETKLQDDLISRGRVLDWINQQIESVTQKQVAGTDGSILTREDLVAMQRCLSTFETVIKNLPSAYDVENVLAELEKHSVCANTIRIGDVVEIISKSSESRCGYGIILTLGSDEYWVFGTNFITPQKLFKDNWILKKTGKHIDLCAVLKQIGE